MRHISETTSQTQWDAELREWFDAEGLIRYAAQGDEGSDVIESSRAPLIALGPHDDDFVRTPHPAETMYPGGPLPEMSMEDFNRYMYRWLEAAVQAGVMRCMQCGKVLRDSDDLPDADTWDAIMIEQELVAWMAVHFDCKKALPKKLKGLHPFDLQPRTPPALDLSQADPHP